MGRKQRVAHGEPVNTTPTLAGFPGTWGPNNGFVAPKAVKTGTTIVGLIYKDGVVLGADTRATSGNIVADKNCEKIHRIAPRIL